MTEDLITVQTTFGHMGEAKAMKRDLREQFNASQILIRTMKSVYRWTENGKEIQDEAEQILTAKIDPADYNDAQIFIANHHRYQLPCIIALPSNPQQIYSPATDCIIAKTLFDNEADAYDVAKEMVGNRISAGAKVCTGFIHLYNGTDWPTGYLLCAETTRERFAKIEQLHPVGKISPWTATPILSGEARFLEWIRKCSEPMAPVLTLQDVLLPGNFASSLAEHTL